MSSVNPSNFIKFLSRKKINFFTGVPDSLLKNLLLELDKKSLQKNIISCNEGTAVSTAAGYYLATKKIPCVYMQNSGLGNAINPLASITHSKVYSIPLLLLVGWRGEPKIIDEPQHMVKGKITLDLLKLLKIKYLIINSKTKSFKKISKLISFSKKTNSVIAIVVQKGTFESINKMSIKKNKFSLKRSEIIENILRNIPNKTSLISTTGYTSRELNFLRSQKKIKNGKDFYMVGGMGHASSVAFGVSKFKKSKVICLDGDGSFLMHLGALQTIGYYGKENFFHVLFNNRSHESVGGQNIRSEKINFKNLSKSLGYKNYYNIKKKSDVNKIKKIFNLKSGPTFVEVLVSNGTFKKLTRPKNFIKIKKEFIK
tara:strand:+ start:1417 stop:2526 length:1110 start_codon:yes stop_codon:yes gene_type:complete